MSIPLSDRLKFASDYMVSILKSCAPIDTGNLLFRGILIESVSDSKVVIRIGNKELVDYAVFTNEPWKDGTNPNEGWVDRAIVASLPVVQAIMGGEITPEDIAAHLADGEMQAQDNGLDRLNELREAR